MIDGYAIDQSMENVVALGEMIRNEGDLKNSKEDLGFIRLTVNSDITERRLVTVGWDSIAGIPNGVTADYLVFAEEPAGYAADADGDNVPDNNAIDSYLNDATRLQVTIGRNTGGMHFVRSHDGSVNGDQLPMFLTSTGLAIAAGAQETEMSEDNHYSAANIKYDEISTNTKILLEIVDPRESTTAIYSIATFGVSDLEYGFEYDNNSGMITRQLGGTVYVTFPIDNLDSVVGEPLYIGKYNSEDESWERFERMGTTFNTTETRYIDTWYAIERGNTSIECPQNLEIYRNRNEHQGTDGFIASANNCIMLVITDGHPLHDESGRDGRVIDPLSIGPVPVAGATRDPGSVDPDPGPDPTPSRGGGGAIGANDLLLLLTALTLLLIASIVRRRSPTPTS